MSLLLKENYAGSVGEGNAPESAVGVTVRTGEDVAGGRQLYHPVHCRNEGGHHECYQEWSLLLYGGRLLSGDHWQRHSLQEGGNQGRVIVILENKSAEAKTITSKQNVCVIQGVLTGIVDQDRREVQEGGRRVCHLDVGSLLERLGQQYASIFDLNKIQVSPAMGPLAIGLQDLEILQEPMWSRTTKWQLVSLVEQEAL